ncbi:ribonuclease III [Geobacter pelophilus]|uniref:Ribonuclease 3 n=1 Tax=Geoanaerobacter pelophilus TaxID=60036 RepID=A0AAW4L5A3_9BACT|nr:ribonuclease III [Geoanaerobacter pelophilus]MBT0662992.1 ribonuclease III [Geoanaerobacter pelophilus]
MTKLPDKHNESIEQRIGYSFSNRTLLEEALTHRSYLNESSEKGLSDNERLEFFGDSVLSLFVSHRLFKDFPEKREGELTRIRAALVDEAALARSAVDLDIGSLIRLGRGEELTGGRTKKSILADAYEALLGALYLDGGAGAVAPIIERHFSLQAAGLKTLSSGRDCKSQFQESSQSVMGATPTYKLIGSSGPDHATVFTVAAFLGDELMGEGSGRSKKEAEQEAARKGLERLAGRCSSGRQ